MAPRTVALAIVSGTTNLLTAYSALCLGPVGVEVSQADPWPMFSHPGQR